jgi:hypothetical protein
VSVDWFVATHRSWHLAAGVVVVAGY